MSGVRSRSWTGRGIEPTPDVHLAHDIPEHRGGGAEYTLAFIGLRRFGGQADTLKMVVR